MSKKVEDYLLPISPVCHQGGWTSQDSFIQDIIGKCIFGNFREGYKNWHVLLLLWHLQLLAWKTKHYGGKSRNPLSTHDSKSAYFPRHMTTPTTKNAQQLGKASALISPENLQTSIETSFYFPRNQWVNVCTKETTHTSSPLNVSLLRAKSNFVKELKDKFLPRS